MLLAGLALAWLLGIAAAAFTRADPAAALVAAGLLGVVSFALSPRPSTLAFIAVGASLIFVAGFRYESTVREPSPIARFNDGSQLRLRGVVGSEPEERVSSMLVRLDVREVFANGDWRAESGGVMMRVPLFPRYDYGDLLDIRGTLEPPPTYEGFDYPAFLFRQGIDSFVQYPEVRVIEHGRGNPLRAALIDIRSQLNESLSGVLPNPEAGLAAGILMGTRSHLPADLRDDMQATGTSHLVAVSGQNVLLLAALLIGGLAWLIGRRRAAWIALFGIVAYAALVGAQPSVVRALIMGCLYIAAIMLGRRNSGIIAIGIAAALMTAHDPQIVHDVGFQLSFAATLGLVLLSSPLTAWLDYLVGRSSGLAGFPPTRGAIDILTMTVASTALTLPIVAIHFEYVSPVAPLANLLVVPAFVAVAGTSSIAAVASNILPGQGSILAWLAWPPAAYMLGMIRILADMPVASVKLSGVHVGHAVGYYAALGALVLWLSNRSVERLEEPSPQPGSSRRLIPVGGLALVLCLASALVWIVASAPNSGRLTVTFLDVGQGDAILIEGPDGHRMLIDGGPSGEAITAALGRNMPFHERRLEMVVLTHPQQDHLGGLPEVLDQYSVRSLLTNGQAGESAAYDALQQALPRGDVSSIEASRGQTLDLGGAARLTVLGDGRDGENVNDSSLVLRLSMGEISFLLTGDITQNGETTLLRTGSDLGSTVLKVAHHGSRTSTSPDLVSRVQPSVDVVSVGARNSYGHPVQEVIDRLNGDLIVRTDQHGDIALSTDGQHIWLKTQRPLGAASVP
jgi:competence protein ComEC